MNLKLGNDYYSAVASGYIHVDTENLSIKLVTKPPKEALFIEYRQFKEKYLEVQRKLSSIKRHKTEFDAKQFCDDILMVYGKTWEEVNLGRKSDNVKLRQVLMWYLRNEFRMTTIAIGRLFGKDHSTVIHCNMVWEHDIKTIDARKQLHDEVLELIKQRYAENQNS